MEKVFSPKLFGLIKDGSVKKNLSKDILAGVVVGIVAIPLAIAFAVASGVSPEKGIITAIVAGFLISLLGGSRVQIGGPTGAFIVIIYGIIQQYGIDGMIIATILAGVIMIGFGLLRLGTLLKFIPHPLIVGFTSGIALVIFSTQISNALGLTLAEVPSSFIGKWGAYFSNINTVNWYAVGITVVTILITVYMPKITSRVPGSFVAILVITPLAMFLPENSVTTIGSLFGEIKCNFAPTFPTIDWGNLSYYLQPALTIAILGSIESLLSAVVADGMISGRHRSNTELIAQGIANIASPLFGGIPATGAIARTATNVKNGGRTPVAGMTHAVVLLLIMLFFGKWASLIPMSCLAGILIVVSYNMSEWRSFRSILRASVFDVVILLVTFFLTVLVDLTVAIEIGVVLAALLFMKRMADNAPKEITGATNLDQDISENYKDLPKGLGIYEISGPFFFGSAKTYCETIRNLGVNYSVLIIRMRHVPFVDSTGLKNLRETILQLTKENTRIVLSGVSEPVKKDLLKGGIGELVGVGNIYPKFDMALSAAKEMVENN
ncbi:MULTISPECIES: SulP family inorganic anion transporter [Butyricimonas]|uniref:SulP family inorganic anion transporter n=1 Tax=Butyricimonas TaxID=574697 RepID=UPI001D0619E0|nr:MULTISPECIES: SulP family inorganic anion transporter [Butyricimonas]MCB6972798.1 STAS domain-containing protein [Butyricimonas synergistica]MCG4519806.1 SulP family inorganic anion transporter [Butyricimonas sp. DFI.6.44]